MKLFTEKSLRISLVVLAVAALTVAGSQTFWLDASSHREAPMIANDPMADNTDVYAFRTDGTDHHVVIIADFIPGQLPDDGPNYYHFGENVRYEIHVKNNPATAGDDITYRFTFSQKNEDPTTFFNIRLGKENLKTTYVCEKSTDGGKTFSAIVTNGKVPPYNIGPRSIGDPVVGLNFKSYESLVGRSIMQASSGETIFCGPVDDPFFVDLGGIMDLGNIRPNAAKDHLECKNVHSIVMRIPIPNLQKDGLHAYNAANVLDDRFIIGVWASASRPKITVLEKEGKVSHQGPWVQVSRLGMPLTNEVVIPIGYKDYWNSLTPYEEGNKFDKYFTNPELALYMDDSQFGKAVPGLSKLRIQRNSLQAFDFGNTHDGLAGLLGNPATKKTAFEPFGAYLLRKGQPRSVDLLPIFHSGVPNLRPYQLAVGKKGNPLAQGKPFINNFLPFGDMLRLNMSTPATPRNSKDFSSLGLIKAAVLGLTDPRFNKTQALEFIPNMDGFPNGRRLEDDVVRIELQAVSGVVLAAIGLWYDDFTVGAPNPVTPDLANVLSFTTGIEANDKPFKTKFPWVASPVNGFELCDASSAQSSIRSVDIPAMDEQSLNLGAPGLLMHTFPNPAINSATFKYRVTNNANVTLRIYDKDGTLVATPLNGVDKEAGTYELNYELGQLKKGTYYVTLSNDGQTVQSTKLVVEK